MHIVRAGAEHIRPHCVRKYINSSQPECVDIIFFYMLCLYLIYICVFVSGAARRGALQRVRYAQSGRPGLLFRTLTDNARVKSNLLEL